MAQLALALRKKTEIEKRDLGSTMAKALTENPTIFLTPAPTAAEITNAGKAVEDQGLIVVQAEADLKAEIAKYEQLDAAFDEVLTRAGKYFENATKGDATLLALTGAPIKGASSPIGPLPAPGNLRVALGDKPGEDDLIWDPINGAMVYIVQYSTTANGPWLQGYMGTMSKCTIAGLTSGDEYFFQACGVGAAGQGPWSDIARKRAA